MPRRRLGTPKKCVFASLMIFIVAQPAHAQMDMSNDLMKQLEQPMPHLPASLGPFTHAISSKSTEAQAFFNQGFQMRYAFGRTEAIRSFREAWKHDPNCAICYWGEAWAWGTDLNSFMSKEEAPHAYEAIQNALRLRDHATANEQAYIEALATRYVQDFNPDDTKAEDEAYAAAMRGVAERYPDDLDAQTLYGEALLYLFPREQTLTLADPKVQEIVTVFERVLARDIHHPGACHLYIHTTESTTEPERAEPCAAFLGSSIPGASHINHMPSHTWNQVGRWGDSVRANLEAWHSDQKAAAGGDAVAIYPGHNLGMLLFAASYDGQGAIAIQAARDQAKLGGDRNDEMLTLVRFGRFDEVLDITERGDGPAAPFWDFAQGYARLKQGEGDLARVYLERLEKAAETTEVEEPFFPVKTLLTVLAGILRGEYEQNAGDTRAAVAALEKAVTAEDTLVYSEPEFLPFTARHWLGAALLEAKRPKDAERVYREDLERHPHNGWSLFGLKAALEAQGKPTADVATELDASWARSDTWLRASRF